MPHHRPGGGSSSSGNAMKAGSAGRMGAGLVDAELTSASAKAKEADKLMSQQLPRLSIDINAVSSANEAAAAAAAIAAAAAQPGRAAARSSSAAGGGQGTGRSAALAAGATSAAGSSRGMRGAASALLAPETPCAACAVHGSRYGSLLTDPEHLICNGMGGAFMHPTHVFSYARFASLPDEAAEATAGIYSTPAEQCTCRWVRLGTRLPGRRLWSGAACTAASNVQARLLGPVGIGTLHPRCVVWPFPHHLPLPFQALSDLRGAHHEPLGPRRRRLAHAHEPYRPQRGRA